MSNPFEKKAKAAESAPSNESEASVEKQLKKDSSKTDAAQETLDVSQIDNKKKMGEFAVDWLISAMTFVSILFFMLLCIYSLKISFDQDKLEWFLKVAYAEGSSFLYKYQAVFAGLVVFMFGDSVRNNKKNKK